MLKVLALVREQCPSSTSLSTCSKCSWTKVKAEVYLAISKLIQGERVAAIRNLVEHTTTRLLLCFYSTCKASTNSEQVPNMHYFTQNKLSEDAPTHRSNIINLHVGRLARTKQVEAFCNLSVRQARAFLVGQPRRSRVDTVKSLRPN